MEPGAGRGLPEEGDPTSCLVVCAEETLRDSVARLLEEGGHTVLACSSAADVDRSFGGERPDAVVVDDGLGEIPGTLLLRTYRALYGRSLPLILLSGRDVWVDARKAGANAVLEPSQVDQIPSLIDRLRTCPLGGGCTLRPATAPHSCLECHLPRKGDPAEAEWAAVQRAAKGEEARILSPGQHFVGKYEILREVSRGAMGIVHRARQVELDRLVALKMLRSDRLASPGTVVRFRREARLLARLRHPHLPTVHEVGTHAGIDYFTMELVEGTPLDQRLPPEGLPEERAARIVRRVGDALAHVHDLGVLHRDVKPKNIIIGPTGTPFLVDFGLAGLVGEPPLPDEEGYLLGTVFYLPREYVRDRVFDEQSDLYSLGVTLFELLAGFEKFPYDDADPVALLEAIAYQEPSSILEHRPDMDRELAEIVDRSLAARDARYGTVRELVFALEAWLRRRHAAG